MVGAIMPFCCVRAGGQAEPAVPRCIPEAGSLAGLPSATELAVPCCLPDAGSLAGLPSATSPCLGLLPPSPSFQGRRPY